MSDKIKLKIAMLEGCEDLVPVRKSEEDSGFDLKCAEDALNLAPGMSFPVSCGFKMSLPVGYEGQVRPRSGLAAKHGIGICNAPGTIDSGYRGIVCAILINHGKESITFKKGDRIAQLVINKLPSVEIEKVEVKDLEQSERGEKGFGSSGIK